MIAHHRLQNLPRRSKFPNVSLFVKGSSEKIGGMTGKIRHDKCHFLCVLVMGICHSVCPDDYELLQVCLLSDKVNKKCVVQTCRLKA